MSTGKNYVQDIIDRNCNPMVLEMKSFGDSEDAMAYQEGVKEEYELIDNEFDLIDVIIHDNDEYILISIKYSGMGINVMEDESIESNIAILNSVSQKIDYSQILGLNNIVIKIK